MSIESAVQKFNPLFRYFVDAPKLVSGNNAAITVYNKNNDMKVGSILLINTGTTPIKVCINSVASATQYHTILNADTASEAGNGGRFQLSSDVEVNSISVFAAAAYTLSVVKFNKQ